MELQNKLLIIAFSALVVTVIGIPEGTLISSLMKEGEQESCCNMLIFESSGSISGSGQEHVLGSYDYYGEGDDGTQVYKQVDGMFWDNYLFYMKYLGLWYIGQTPGENSGYAMNQNAIQRCPEKLGQDWKWWNQPEGVWTLDDQAEISCR